MTDQVGLAIAGLSAFNLLALLGFAWKFGRWTGTVDARLRDVERRLESNGPKA